MGVRLGEELEERKEKAEDGEEGGNIAVEVKAQSTL
jgi:hypothetical protein